MRKTLGRGVDIVLDLFSAGKLQSLWKCLVGGGPVAENGNLDLQPFTSNRSYTRIDVSHLAVNKPDKMRQ